MIADIIKQIRSEDWFNVSKEVEIAKGRNKIINNLSDGKRYLKRVMKGKKIYK